MYQIDERYIREQEKGCGKLLWVLIAAMLLLAFLPKAAMLLLVGDRAPNRKEELVYETSVVARDILRKPKEERQKELDSITKGRILAMSISAAPGGKGTGKDRSVNWLIENPESRGKLARVGAYRDGTGEKIYETGAIKPGSYVESAPSDMNLPAGEYDCTARFYIYRLETGEYIGRATAKTKLMICE